MTTRPQRLPMFPLGGVLFPRQILPLHVFEPRYRHLMASCLEHDRRFGVTLIERGHEVGGGDQRFAVGTVAEIIEAARLPDGRWILEAAGRERLRVERWLPDDPHPWAEVTLLAEAAEDLAPGAADAVTGLLRQLLALRSELGEPSPPATLDVDPDPLVRSWQIAALARLTPLDGLAVLETDGASGRIAVLEELVAEQVTMCRARLGGG